MKRFLAVLFLFCCCRLFAANGDTVSLIVKPSGTTVDWAISGLDTNGTYNFNLQGITNIWTGTDGLRYTNRYFLPTTQTPTFYAHDPTGGLRLVYAISSVRKVYPGSTTSNWTNNESFGGGNVTNEIVLSDFLYPGDVVTVSNWPAGIYTQNSTPTTTNIWFEVVTSGITNLWPKPVSDWSRNHGGDLVTNTTYKVCSAGFHRSAAMAETGEPLRAVQFYGIDEAGNRTPTNTVTRSEIDWSYDAATPWAWTPVIEYCGTLDLSSLNNSNFVRIHRIDYPLFGTNFFSTEEFIGVGFPETNGVPTWTQIFYCTNFPLQVCLVDTNGNDATASVVPAGSWNPNSPPVGFTTLSKAMASIARTNFAKYQKFDSTGLIYATNGWYRLNEATVNITNEMWSYCEMIRHPNASISNVVITNFATQGNLGPKTKFNGINIRSSATPVQFDNMKLLWFDYCWFSESNALARLVDTVTNWSVTRSRITKMTQGLAAASGEACNYPKLLRGCDVSDAALSVWPITILGNARLSGTNSQFNVSDGHTGRPRTNFMPIIAFNRFLCQSNFSGHSIDISGAGNSGTAVTNYTRGGVFVQNVMECINDINGMSRVVSIGGSASSTADTNALNHFMVWNNTLVGSRFNWLENAGTPDFNADRGNHSLLNNACDNLNSKDDLDYTLGTRSGNFSVMYWVGAYGNIDLELTGFDGPWNWSSLGGIGNFTYSGTTASASYDKGTNHVHYRNRQSNLTGLFSPNQSVRVGGGDYRLLSDHLFYPPTKWVLAYDIAGNRRSRNDLPGAYAVGNARSGL